MVDTTLNASNDIEYLEFSTPVEFSRPCRKLQFYSAGDVVFTTYGSDDIGPIPVVIGMEISPAYITGLSTGTTAGLKVLIYY